MATRRRKQQAPKRRYDVYRRCDDETQRSVRNCRIGDTLYIYVGTSIAVNERRAISNAAYKRYGDELERGLVKKMIAIPGEIIPKKSLIFRPKKAEEQLLLAL